MKYHEISTFHPHIQKKHFLKNHGFSPILWKSASQARARHFCDVCWAAAAKAALRSPAPAAPPTEAAQKAMAAMAEHHVPWAMRLVMAGGKGLSAFYILFPVFLFHVFYDN
jgi:hypothetical protein